MSAKYTIKACFNILFLPVVMDKLLSEAIKKDNTPSLATLPHQHYYGYAYIFCSTGNRRAADARKVWQTQRLAYILVFLTNCSEAQRDSNASSLCNLRQHDTRIIPTVIRDCKSRLVSKRAKLRSNHASSIDGIVSWPTPAHEQRFIVLPTTYNIRMWYAHDFYPNFNVYKQAHPVWSSLRVYSRSTQQCYR